MDKKLDETKRVIKRSLGLPVSPTSSGGSTGFEEVIRQLKEKFKDPSTTKSERIQILTLIPSSWSNIRVSEEFDTTLYMVKVARKLYEDKGILATPNAKLGRPLDEVVKVTVIAFYNDDQVTVLLPGMKDFICVRDANGQKVRHQKKLILCNLKELYAHFKLENPNLRIGFSTFATLRPKHCTLAGGAGTHTVCVCPFHQNMKLMISGCSLQLLTKESETSIACFEDLVPLLLCPVPQQTCHLLKCKNCPDNENLKDTLLKVLDETAIEEVKYSQWVSKPRTTLETYVKSANEFVDDFCEQAKKLLPHNFIAKQQSRFFKSLKANSKQDECLVICDFAENYAFIAQDAAPSFHWNNDQATIFPVVVYYKSDEEIAYKSLVVISDNLNHDSVAVHVFTRIIVDFIKAEIMTPVRIYYWSDGAPQQFKNFKNFINLWYHDRDFSVPAEWHFFATSHGKGPCDGIGGTLKRLSRRASLQLPPDRQILSPRGLFDWTCTVGTLPSITKRFSSVEDYEAAKDSLGERFATAKPIPSTQKQHCFIPTPEGMKTKLFSSSPDFQLYSVVRRRRAAANEYEQV